VTGRAIGGYFELELPDSKTNLYPQARRFQSARASFLALLRAGNPKRVWMPRFICDAMLAPLRSAGIEIGYYAIDAHLEIVDDVSLAKDEWLFYVNYFGVSAGNVDKVLSRFDPAQVVLDHSQAFFAAPRQCLATIYSARKFFGVPDGGLLITELPIAEPHEIDDGSLGRSTHLLKRLLGAPEPGYPDYQRAEQSLEDFEPRQMSPLTARILGAVDIDAARMKRNANFIFLHERLGGSNEFHIDLSRVDGPLCYPFFTLNSNIRQALIRQRIFVATYWPDVMVLVEENSTEAGFARNIIPLPCDQRYNQADMQAIVDLCSILLSK
jgi:hypothetical protein